MAPPLRQPAISPPLYGQQQYYVPAAQASYPPYQPVPSYLQGGGGYGYGGYPEPQRSSLPPPAPLPPPKNGEPGGLMMPPTAPRTHYVKLSSMMLIIGGAVGYALHSAQWGSSCGAKASDSSALVVANTTPLFEWFFAPSEGAAACGDGLFIPGPTPSPANILMFLLLLLWSFVGVAIGADAFMVAIEMITSQEKIVHRYVDGQYKEVTALVWNGTVANLTLMALGSSAPEILLSVIEITTSGFYAGQLGPSTIVGSAAFNLLVISAVCVTAIPAGEGRFILDRSVFAITAVFSVLAYVWLLVILMYNTPNIVDIWEGVVTFVAFPVLVWLAYLADQGCCSCGARNEPSSKVVAISKSGQAVDMDAVTAAYGEGLTEEEQQERLAEMLGRPKTRAFYRVNATRGATGGQTAEAQKQKQLAESGAYAVVEFTKQMLVIESGRRVITIAVRRTRNLALPCSVGYRSVGQATEAKGEGLLQFAPNETTKELRLPMLPDEAAFYVVLVDPSPHCEVGAMWSCAVLVEKPASPGMLKFERERLSVKESQGQVIMKIVRVGGAAGKVKCRLHTKDGSAIAPKDYQARDELVQLQDGQTETFVPITIMDDDQYEADETFQVILSEPEGGVTFDPTADGGAEKAVATVTIISDEQVRRKVDELAALVWNADDAALSASTWKEQFLEAFEFEGTGARDAVMYLLALPWKVAFALTPPVRMAGGWLCFFVTLAFIGLLTALIGDLAAHMGCCMGMMPSITAITFVALGTSLPDTFASRTAAMAEPHADASIGNITGSNSVNVFLGLGLPWMIAAVYWSHVGSSDPVLEAQWRARYSTASWYVEGMPVGFVVEAADLAFSVSVFTVCALVCLSVLVLRRGCLGYELGGPSGYAYATAALFVSLWFVYIGASVLYTYGYFG